MSGLSFQPAVRGSIVDMLGIPWPPTSMSAIDLPEREVSLQVSCLCEQVSATITGPVPTHFICHCFECKLITGGTHGDFLIVLNNSHVTWKCDTRELRCFSYYVAQEETENKNIKKVYRCPTCFTPIFMCRGDPDTTEMHFFVGCVEDALWLNAHRPDCEISKYEKCTWLPHIAPSMTLPPKPKPQWDSGSDKKMELKPPGED
ncbi:hypothetical protein F5Y11DRAFT_320710 [Daldinia sp. FL1419]|nr:hypothetical protein F5Y11DRAFT_320710 [Daldinia sp. FL1419]